MCIFDRYLSKPKIKSFHAEYSLQDTGKTKSHIQIDPEQRVVLSSHIRDRLSQNTNN